MLENSAAPWNFPACTKFVRALLFRLGLVLALAGLAWFGRESWLRELAHLWIVTDEITPADATVVLGGGLSIRPMAAAEFYRNGMVHKVLVANVGLDQSEALGAVPSHSSLIRGALLKFGVPEAAIASFGHEVRNTHEEVVALREWAIRGHLRSILVPTEVFSSRRVRWMLEHELAGNGIRIEVAAFDPTDYDRDHWWRSEQGILNFQNEVIKYIYYRLKY
jgi:uncharacterized SAM-binding protein YcdF (DUF218 family)